MKQAVSSFDKTMMLKLDKSKMFELKTNFEKEF
jgi:hypothetical protein